MPLDVQPVVAHHHTAVGPVRVRFFSDEWVTNVRRKVAWRASCSCSWRGGSRSKWENAIADARQHKEEPSWMNAPSNTASADLPDEPRDP